MHVMMIPQSQQPLRDRSLKSIWALQGSTLLQAVHAGILELVSCTLSAVGTALAWQLMQQGVSITKLPTLGCSLWLDIHMQFFRGQQTALPLLEPHLQRGLFQ